MVYSRREKIVFVLLFSLAWILWRIPLLKHLEILNGDYAINYLMAKFWFSEGPYKFMWGNQYLGTLETFWNAICFYVLPLKVPFLKIPNLILGLVADLIFISLFQNRGKTFCLLLSACLVFLPNFIRIIDPQLVPGYSYSTLCICIFSALAIRSSFWRGILLGLAFYTQPISVYFIAPFFLAYFLSLQRKEIFSLCIGFLIPFLFTILPIAGDALNFEELSGKVGERLFYPTASLFAHSFAAFLSIPINFNEYRHSDLFISFFCLIFIAFAFYSLNYLRSYIAYSKTEQLIQSKNLSVWVFAISFVMIPFLFIIRRYEAIGLDAGISRYLWLWHFSLYFVLVNLLALFLKRSAFWKKTSISLLFICFIGFSCSRIGDLLRLHNPNLNFENIIQYLNQEKLPAVIGDYWDVYPLSFFSVAEYPNDAEKWIVSRPYPGAVRQKQWAKQIELGPEFYYLCRDTVVNCNAKFEDKINLSSKKFVKSKSEAQEFIFPYAETYSLQKYEMDESNFLVPLL